MGQDRVQAQPRPKSNAKRESPIWNQGCHQNLMFFCFDLTTDGSLKQDLILKSFKFENLKATPIPPPMLQVP